MDFIKELKENEVFVFGSNLAGIHGGGAARTAMMKFGAEYGKGIGHYGKSYAIPTKDYNIETLNLWEIKPHVDNFIDYAKRNTELIFLVTNIGCGLAGYEIKDIAPFFRECLNMHNVKLSKEFYDFLSKK